MSEKSMFRFSTSNKSPFLMAIGKVKQRPDAPICQGLVVHDGSEVVVGQAQAILLADRSLLSDATQALQPELAAGGDLVALFGKHDREESGQLGIPAHFRRYAQEQVSFPAARGPMTSE